jgi:hypothetical protein
VIEMFLMEIIEWRVNESRVQKFLLSPESFDSFFGGVAWPISD